MISKKVLVAGALAASAVQVAGYTLIDSYVAANWWDKFNIFHDDDPTHGYVRYVDLPEAKEKGLVANKNNQMYMGVDYVTTLDPDGRGRPSIRVESKKKYTKALIIADIEHMPSTSKHGCGSWPAFWSYGDDWPNNGEIDVIEGVNSVIGNQATLHTTAGCNMTNLGASKLTKVVDTDCHGLANGGCGQKSPLNVTYGDYFNQNKGGVFAMEWTARYIAIWFFDRKTAEAKNLTLSPTVGVFNNATGNATIGGGPVVTTFGTPIARFSGPNCDILKHFNAHNIVFDMTFCGDWAGKDWSTDATCGPLAPRCQDYVGKNPADFKENYWLINRVDVFQRLPEEAGEESASNAAADALYRAAAAGKTVKRSHKDLFARKNVAGLGFKQDDESDMSNIWLAKKKRATLHSRKAGANGAVSRPAKIVKTRHTFSKASKAGKLAKRNSGLAPRKNHAGHAAS